MPSMSQIALPSFSEVVLAVRIGQNGMARRLLRTILEANPNPQIAKGEDFAASAEKVGLTYETVLQRIINLGLRWQPESVA